MVINPARIARVAPGPWNRASPQTWVTAKFAGYSAANPTNTTRVGSRIGINANTSTAGIQRLGMSFTADMVCKDNVLCSAYLAIRQNHCSSTMLWIPETPDEGLNHAITDYLHGSDGCGGIFSTMGIDCSMQDAFMRTADLECPVKGDSALVNLNWNEDLRLMEVSADQIGEIYNFQPVRRCSLSRQIYRDNQGNIERIEIRECAGNDCTYYAGRYFRGPDCVAYKIYERQEHWYGNPQIYDAADVHYFRDPASYRGYRGITHFHTSLPYMQKSDDIFQAALGIAQRQARTSAYIYNNSGAPPEIAYPGQQTDSVTGQITYAERTPNGPFEEYFLNGDSVVPNAPSAPGPDVINGIEAANEFVALGLRVTYSFLVNGSKMGGVMARGEWQKNWKELSRLQTMIHRPRFRRIVHQTLMNAVRRNVFVLPRGMTSDEFLRGRAMLPTSPVTDAFNDSKAMIDEIREGLIAPQDAISETNRNWKDVVRKSGEFREAVEMEAWKRTQRLKAAGCTGIVSPQEISATSDNPQQGAAAEQLSQGKPASGGDNKSVETAKLALALLAFDESKHPRGQPENKGEFGPGAGAKKEDAPKNDSAAKTGDFPEAHEKAISEQRASANGNKWKIKALKDAENESRAIPSGAHDEMADNAISKAEKTLSENKPHVIDATEMVNSGNAITRHIGNQMHDAVIDPQIHAEVELDATAKQIQDLGRIGKVFHPDAFPALQKIRDAKEKLFPEPEEDSHDEPPAEVKTEKQKDLELAASHRADAQKFRHQIAAKNPANAKEAIEIKGLEKQAEKRDAWAKEFEDKHK